MNGFGFLSMEWKQTELRIDYTPFLFLHWAGVFALGFQIY
jgi:hypothetical protein